VPSQQQHSGDDVTNVQAGRDATVVYQGLSVEEAREVALDVFRQNFIELRGIAEDIARGRAEKITEDFLRELERQPPDSLQTAADPDLQRALFHAQSEFACSGEEDLEQALVDLLVDRAAESGRGIRTLALNEAISSAPKLTAGQRRAIAICFLHRYTSWYGTPTLESYYRGRFRTNSMPLALDLPAHESAYQHIISVGAGGDAIGPTALGAALLHLDPGWFTRGFTADEAQPLGDHLGNPALIMPCIRDSSRLQLTAMHEHEVQLVAASAGLPDLSASLLPLLRRGAMTPQEVRDDVVANVPEARRLFEVWDTTMLGRLTLTTVGTAIGHAYWRRVTGGSASLAIWIPD
jgi:hypothetical protein